MSQKTTGFRALLLNPLLYNLSQSLMGVRRTRRWLVRAHIRPANNSRILDLGCGTAEILDFLPVTENTGSYLGFDPNDNYLLEARRRFGKRGIFQCHSIRDLDPVHVGQFDLVLALGVLHHLDDPEARALMNLAKSALKPGGRLITFDGVYLQNQSRVARFLLNKDRGQNVRTSEEYLSLTRDSFEQVSGIHRHQSMIPYDYWVMECTR